MVGVGGIRKVPFRSQTRKMVMGSLLMKSLARVIGGQACRRERDV